MIRESEVGDVWSGQDREDTLGALPGGAFDQGDLPGFVGFSGDCSAGFAFRSDLEIVNKPNDIKEFMALCRRWVGERTFA